MGSLLEPNRVSPSNNIKSLLCKVPYMLWKTIRGTFLLRIMLWNVHISVLFNLRNACKPFSHPQSPSHTSRQASASNGHSSLPYFLRVRNRNSSWILRSQSVVLAVLLMLWWGWVLEIRIHLLRSCTSRFSNFYREFHFQNRDRHYHLPPSRSVVEAACYINGIVGYLYWLRFGLRFAEL